MLFDRKRQLAPPPKSTAQEREAIVGALNLSIDDLRAERDARRAIVAAYARIEKAFLIAGLPKRPSEAPHEFLVRSLRTLDTSADSATRLTELFELAKFSNHPLDLGMRDEAIEAFLQLRHELAAPIEKTASPSSQPDERHSAPVAPRSETSA